MIIIPAVLCLFLKVAQERVRWCQKGEGNVQLFTADGAGTWGFL